MKKGIHPDYRDVVFMDAAADFKFLTRSTARSKETVQWEDGKEYPLIRLEISSASHPFFTGQQKFVDTAGRIEKFQRRFTSVEGQAPVKSKRARKADAIKQAALESKKAEEEAARLEAAKVRDARKEERRKKFEESNKAITPPVENESASDTPAEN